MGQPTAPPLSFRPGAERLGLIDAYALKHGLSRHAAILELLDLSLKGAFHVATSRPTPKPVPGSDAAKRKAARLEAPAETRRSLVAGLDIPVFRGEQRRPMQRGPKK